MQKRKLKFITSFILQTLALSSIALLPNCSQSDFAGSNVVKNNSDKNSSTPSGQTNTPSVEASGSDPLVVDGILVTNCESGKAGSPLDFEKLNDVAPTPRTPISDQFKATYFLSFALSNGGSPIIADVGGTYDAYSCTGCGNDGVQADSRAKVGSFFLTDDGVKGAAQGLVVNYEVPAAESSGDLLDVDGGEIWTIEGFDKNGAPVAKSVVTSSGSSGDGRATRWELRATKEAPISKITFSPSKPSGGTFGLGFDNFSPGKICP